MLLLLQTFPPLSLHTSWKVDINVCYIIHRQKWFQSFRIWKIQTDEWRATSSRLQFSCLHESVSCFLNKHELKFVSKWECFKPSVAPSGQLGVQVVQKYGELQRTNVASSTTSDDYVCSTLKMSFCLDHLQTWSLRNSKLWLEKHFQLFFFKIWTIVS